MDGTTFKLNTATTNSRTRSQRPKTLRRRGASWTVGVFGTMTSFDKPLLRYAGSAGNPSVARRAYRRSAAFVLRLGECRSDIFKRRDVLIDVGFRMLHRNRPLLVPPIRLRE